MKKKALRVIIFILPIVIIAAIPFASAYEKGGGILSAYIELIDEKSNETVDRLNLSANLLEGTLSSTDKYSYYLDNSEFESHVNEYQDASFVGIGVTMIEDAKGAYVLNVFMNSPAQRAGLRAGDVIVSAAGQDIAGMKLQDIASLIKGPENSEVEIGCLKQGVGEIVTIRIRREKIDITTVDYTIYKEAAYIRITGFTNQTGSEFIDVLDKVDKAGTNNLILDIRDNGGGAINGCINVARALLEDADIVRLDFKFNGFLDFLYKAYENDRDYNIVMLVNENSASASEILAAAIQDNEEGILVGERTFGKSLVQSTFQILDMEAFEKYSAETGLTNMFLVTRGLAMEGRQASEDEWAGAVKLTVGEYLTPNGKSINNKGIEPDFEIDYDGSIHFDESAEGMLWIYDKYDIGMASEEIKKAKVILKELGFYDGGMNGQYDSATKNAVAGFQSAEGLYPYGVLDFTTQQALNNRLRMLGSERDAQLQLAYMKLMEVGE